MLTPSRRSCCHVNESRRHADRHRSIICAPKRTNSTQVRNRRQVAYWPALPAELSVYLHVVARGVPLGSLRACESGSVVHEAPRAWRCERCRKSPTRPAIRPWHISVSLPDRRPRTISVLRGENGNGPVVTLRVHSPRNSRLTYTGICQGCGQEFSDKRGDVAYCDECQLPRNRTRRSRARTELR